MTEVIKTGLIQLSLVIGGLASVCIGLGVLAIGGMYLTMVISALFK